MGSGLKLLCLRREYLSNKEKDAPLSLNRSGLVFFVDGHRLSSLCREANIAKFWLTNRYLPSLLLKYSNPARSTGAAL